VSGGSSPLEQDAVYSNPVKGYWLAGAVLACILGQFNCAKYQPHTLDPVQSEARYRARSLNDPALIEFLRTQSGAPVIEMPARLDPETLANVAIFLSPELESARARIAGTEAAVITARQRINPSISAAGGYNRTPESVATYSVSPAFTIETAGKRGYRILAAQKLAEAARVGLYESAWQVRSHLRAALLAYYSAQRRLALLRNERTVRDEIAGLFAKRVSLGEASIPELNAARAEQATVAVNLRAAESEVAQSFASVAAACGLPVSALEGRSLDLTSFETPPDPASLPMLRVQQAGLLHRPDIRRSLAEYEAADAGLRLELASQYPNIALNPAYSFQEGFPSYTLGSVIDSLPVLNRHQGPIAEAEAGRREAEALFNALQARAISETELALRHYRSAVEEWRTVKDTVEGIQQQREAAVTTAFRAGESDRLDVAQARLATLAANQANLAALVRAQTALGALEDAVESPLKPETKN
jgi:outer membrane protein, heavy metal efflux system